MSAPSPISPPDSFSHALRDARSTVRWGLSLTPLIALTAAGSAMASGDEMHHHDHGAMEAEAREHSAHEAHEAHEAYEKHEAHEDHGSAHEVDEHANHEVAPGVTRSVASYTAPDVLLIDQNGEQVALPTLLEQDEPVLLNFIFTTCTAICPAMSSTFAQVQHQLGDDRDRVRLVSISIDPEQDTPARMADYARRFRADRQWSMLTGALEDCIAVQKAFDTYRGDKMYHAPVTLLRPEKGGEWIRFEGFASASDLVSETRAQMAH